MGCIDPTKPDDDAAWKRQQKHDHETADDFAKVAHFNRDSTYRGSPGALRRMANRAGKPLPESSED